MLCRIDAIDGDHSVLRVVDARQKHYSIDCALRYKNINVGDIIQCHESGDIFQVWDNSPNGKHDNVIFIGDKCNCSCLTCPQPAIGERVRIADNVELIDLLPNDMEVVCFSGGERFPNIQLQILSNGISLADRSYVRRLRRALPQATLFGINLYSCIPHIHDGITARGDSFFQTVNGIWNLIEAGFPVELRHVVCALNIQHLELYCEFVSRNFPEIVHVAIMGMEVMGRAKVHKSKLHYSPTQYWETFVRSHQLLKASRISHSFYNFPHCVMPPEVYSVLVKSISNWNQEMPEQCKKCDYQELCCGLFKTGNEGFIEYVQPIL
jgi:MoaA/NifB/PqqE/SkfB family radical SAM enzyme